MHTCQRRLQIVSNIVGDMPYALVQFLDACKHAVEVFRQPIEFVTRPAYRKPSGQIAAHDTLRGHRNFIDPLQGTPADKKPDQKSANAHDAERSHQRPPHDEADLLGLAKIPADHDPDTIGHDDHTRDGGVRLRIIAFAIAFIGDGTLDPALILQHADFYALDVAGDDPAGWISDKIKVSSGLAAAPVDRSDQTRNAATFISLADALYFFVDRGFGLRRQ